MTGCPILGGGLWRSQRGLVAVWKGREVSKVDSVDGTFGREGLESCGKHKSVAVVLDAIRRAKCAEIRVCGLRLARGNPAQHVERELRVRRFFTGNALEHVRFTNVVAALDFERKIRCGAAFVQTSVAEALRREPAQGVSTWQPASFAERGRRQVNRRAAEAFGERHGSARVTELFVRGADGAGDELERRAELEQLLRELQESRHRGALFGGPSRPAFGALVPAV